MKPLTRKTMNIIAYLIAGLLCFTQTTGCALQDFEKVQEKQVKLEMTFELPPPWKIRENQPIAFLDQPAHTGTAHFVKLNAIAWYRGTSNEDAKKKALEGKTEADKLTELMIADTKVYMMEGQTQAEFGGAYTSLYFIHDGWVISVTVHDAYEYHKDALEKAIQTLRIKELK